MNDALYIAATGMHAQQTQVDTIAHNLANLDTPAFKKGRVSFEDLMYRELARAGAPGADAALASEAALGASGLGVAIASIGKTMTQGDFKKTDQPLDLAIRGNGFFEVSLADGSRAYTRAGNLQLDRERMLTTPGGHVLSPAIQVPADALSITVQAGGKVLAQLPGEKKAAEIGQIELAEFLNPQALAPRGDNLYTATERSGDARMGRPAEGSVGTLEQGFLEASNVKLIDEFVNLVVAQRAYELSSKAIQAADEMLGIANNLRR